MSIVAAQAERISSQPEVSPPHCHLSNPATTNHPPMRDFHFDAIRAVRARRDPFSPILPLWNHSLNQSNIPARLLPFGRIDPAIRPSRLIRKTRPNTEYEEIT
jgi:hypothetical protein